MQVNKSKLNVKSHKISNWTECFNFIARWQQRLWCKRWEVWKDRGGVGVESCKIMFLWAALPIHLSRHFCCRMYRLATMHSVTDRQTDRQTTPHMSSMTD